tara:strand:- start:15 stop:647 length:633 start_codon:yes stop_codon:yes gene_type:complete
MAIRRNMMRGNRGKLQTQNRDIPPCCAYLANPGNMSSAEMFGTFTCHLGSWQGTSQGGTIEDNCNMCGTVPFVAYDQCANPGGGATYSYQGTYSCHAVSMWNDGITLNDVCCECNSMQDCYDQFGNSPNHHHPEIEYQWRCSSTYGGVGYGQCGDCYEVEAGRKQQWGGQGSVRGARPPRRKGGHIMRNMRKGGQTCPKGYTMGANGVCM